MKELIRFDEETQRTFLKEVSGEELSLPSPVRRGGRGFLEDESRTHLLKDMRGFRPHWGQGSLSKDITP